MSVDQYKKEIGMMNLEKLIQDREGISSKKFPIPDKELLFRYEQLYTGAVNDVMREFCLLEQALPGRIKPLREYHSVAGFAFTVKSAPNVKALHRLFLLVLPKLRQYPQVLYHPA